MHYAGILTNRNDDMQLTRRLCLLRPMVISVNNITLKLFSAFVNPLSSTMLKLQWKNLLLRVFKSILCPAFKLE